jgi:hypothetical protein
MSKKSDASQIKVGEFLSEIQYYKVLEVSSSGIFVKNIRGLEFTISKSIVEEGLHSDRQFNEEQQVTRTELVQVLSNAGETVFTACFNKKLDAKALKESFNDPKISVKSVAAMQRMLLGEERVLTGFLLSSDALSGRFQVVDLEDPEGRAKQIDQRTLNWVILRNIKYTVK